MIIRNTIIIIKNKVVNVYSIFSLYLFIYLLKYVKRDIYYKIEKLVYYLTKFPIKIFTTL